MNLNATLQQLFGDDGRIENRQPVGGGDINIASVLTISGGRKIFIKENNANLENMFIAEALGLRRLGEAAKTFSSPSVPEVYAWGTDGNRAFLLLQWIPAGRLKSGGDFGRALAVLHQEMRRSTCGFDTDNWIGSTPQNNNDTKHWIEFFRDNRLGYQWSLLRRNGFGDTQSERDMQSLLKRLANLLPGVDDDRPSLLHGDLWGGNWMADLDGRPWLIDPAVYYGHREADIAMTQLFGGFPSGFYQAYNQIWPMQPGFAERRDIYNLYHLLNHVNLFGLSYWRGVQDILRRFG